MAQSKTKWSTRTRILSALLVTKTDREAAEIAGVTERTVYSYKQDPDFLKDLRAYGSAGLDYAVSLSARNMEEAISTLRNIMLNESITPQNRIGAAKVLLDFGLRSHEAVEILTRLEALEKSAEEQEWS